MMQSANKKDRITNITQQKRFELAVNGKHITTHVVDFLVCQGGVVKVVEAKGFPTETWAIKHRLFEALYPGIPYEIWRK
jgi:hypothetical protein